MNEVGDEELDEEWDEEGGRGKSGGMRETEGRNERR